MSQEEISRKLYRIIGGFHMDDTTVISLPEFPISFDLSDSLDESDAVGGSDESNESDKLLYKSNESNESDKLLDKSNESNSIIEFINNIK